MTITSDTTCFTRLYWYNTQHSKTQSQRQTSFERAFQSISLLNAHLNFYQHFLYMLELHVLPQFENTTISIDGAKLPSADTACVRV
jgi:hypothetical protein